VEHGRKASGSSHQTDPRLGKSEHCICAVTTLIGIGDDQLGLFAEAVDAEVDSISRAKIDRRLLAQTHSWRRSSGNTVARFVAPIPQIRGYQCRDFCLITSHRIDYLQLLRTGSAQ
jgi:hypothetical protein